MCRQTCQGSGHERRTLLQEEKLTWPPRAEPTSVHSSVSPRSQSEGKPPWGWIEFNLGTILYHTNDIIAHIYQAFPIHSKTDYLEQLPVAQL